MDAGFYRAFEDRHRGSRALISQRLQAYRPFYVPFTQTADAAPTALDIGCGRGEWVELLQQQGFQVQGIDLDAGMIRDAEPLGLPLVQGDGLQCLAQQTAQTLNLISAFHVVEHIPFQAVMQLARDALRALKPGGLLILETPNPENIMVGSHYFYLDPSHVKPIPPALLSFALEYAGFERVRVVRLNEATTLHESDHHVSLYEVLAGASPDYSIVAQKAGPAAYVQQWDAAFAQGFGVELEQLTGRYQQQWQAQLHAQHQHAQVLREQIGQLQQQYQQQQQQLVRLERLFYSYTLMGVGLRVGRYSKRVVKAVLRFFLNHFDKRAEKNPQLRHFVRAQLGRVPALQRRIHRVTQTHVPEPTAPSAPSTSSSASSSHRLGTQEQQLFNALQQAQTHHKGE